MNPSDSSSHYDVLGVSQSATPQEIRRAFREIANIVHPDRGGDRITFEVLQAAYEVLRDPEQRAAYDRGLADLQDCPGDVQAAGSTAVQRDRQALRTRSNRQSWNQTPRDFVSTGVARELKQFGLAIPIAIVVLVVVALLS